jgi:hypothetical protein
MARRWWTLVKAHGRVAHGKRSTDPKAPMRFPNDEGTEG